MNSKTTYSARKEPMLSKTLVFCLGLVAMIVVITSWPLFSNPQVESDDYRYLHQIQKLEKDFQGNFLEASVVENRWDHLWWIDSKDKVRFYRPTVVLSYWLDARLFGDQVITGLLITNLIIHLLCACLATVILFRWIGASLPAILASGLFAAFLCHHEVIWYIAGRTDSLAALGFLAGLALHICSRNRARLRWLALPCYAFAFITKELTICLPLICLLHDRLLEKRDLPIKNYLKSYGYLYAAYAILAIGIQLLRSSIIGDSGARFAPPYLISPLDPGFIAHLYTQVRSYSENLMTGNQALPFVQYEALNDSTTRLGCVLSLLFVFLIILE
ncbi:MAG: hypothetical protein KJ645_10885 [Planctomycetes bacterium]|nr:hypothetical protein [Planctomycetota bacterium]